MASTGVPCWHPAAPSFSFGLLLFLKRLRFLYARARVETQLVSNAICNYTGDMVFFASSHGFHSIPPFQLPELEYVLSQMPCNKATDATGVVVEMFKHGNVELHTCLLNIFNGMLQSGCFDESWRVTLFF